MFLPAPGQQKDTQENQCAQSEEGAAINLHDVLALLFPFNSDFYIIEHGHHKTHTKETGNWQDKEKEWPEPQDIVSEKGPHPQQFSYEPKGHHPEQKPEPHTQTVPKGSVDGVLAGKCLQPHGNYGEGHDQFDKDAHLLIGLRHISGEDQVNDGYPRCNGKGIGGDADAGVDMVFDGSNCATGKYLNKQDGDSQKEAIHDGCAYSNSRTHGEGQTEYGVLAQYSIK